MAEPGPALCSGCLSGLLFAHLPLMCSCVLGLCLALFVTDLECFRLAGGCAGQCADDSPQQHKRQKVVCQSVCFGRCRSARGVGWVHTTGCMWLAPQCSAWSRCASPETSAGCACSTPSFACVLCLCVCSPEGQPAERHQDHVARRAFCGDQRPEVPDI